ncbi:MAG: helix-turn-helix domain-containing protein [Rhizomicrobium sp.]
MDISKLDYRARRVRNERSVLPSSWFSTRELAASDRFTAWHSTMGVFLGTSLSRHESADRFSGEIEGYLLDDIVFTRARASRQKFDRDDAMIARDGLDHYMIELFFDGSAEMNVHGRTIRNRPGQIMTFDLGEVMDSFNSDFDLLCILIPRARLSPLLARPDSIHGLIPCVEDGPGYLLAEYLRSVYAVLPKLSATETGPAARALLELIAGTLNRAAVGARWEGAGRHQSLLLRAQVFIRENLRSPGLSSGRIAHAVGVSRTTLYQLFEPCGGVAAYVREIRLRKCLTEIMSARYAGTPIAEIGYRWGFTDAATFTRAFRRRFALTPSEARASSHAWSRLNRTDIDPRAGNRRHEEWIASLA